METSGLNENNLATREAMAARVLDREMTAMQGFIDSKFGKLNFLQQPEFFDSFERLKDEGGGVALMKCEEYRKFLHLHEMRGFRSVCEALRQDMQDPSSFDAALLEMPQKLVCMTALLAKMQYFELVHAAINDILSRAKFDSVVRWSHTLEKMLNQVSPGWYDIPLNNLDTMLSAMIENQHVFSCKVWQWCEAPRSIEDAFHKCVWPGLEQFCGGKVLDKDQINKIMILAAENDFPDLFRECLELGADAQQIIKVVFELDWPKGMDFLEASLHDVRPYYEQFKRTSSSQ